MTCDNTTDICPGTELTCNCSVLDSPGLVWRLPRSVTITFDDKAGVGSNETNGIFVAVVTNNTVVVTNNTAVVTNYTGVLESMLIYTASATESLVDGTIECKEEGIYQQESEFVTITDDTFAG